MEETNRKLWFKARKYGYGWTPASWQGWVVIGLYLVVIFYGIGFVYQDPQNAANLWAYWAWVAIATGILLFISAAKGEKPGWHWGGKKIGKVEMLDELDEKGVKTGRTIPRSDAHKLGLWHKSAHVYIINSEYKILLQLRSPQKESNPNQWGGSAGGHVEAGQTSLNTARRETKEELGIRLNNSDFNFIGVSKDQVVLNSGTYKNNQFNDVYLVRKDIDISSFHVQASEVSEVRWVPLEEFRSRVAAHDPSIVPCASTQVLFDYYDKNIK